MSAAAGQPLLEVSGVTVRFGGITAVDDVSFGVAKGELAGLIGPNGAGKTTMLRAVTGAVRPRTGRVLLDGVDITATPSAIRARMGLGLSHQIVRPFRNMTIRENVMVSAGYLKTGVPFKAMFQVRRGAEHARAEALLDKVGIAHLADQSPATQPLGVLKRLEVARALALDPKLLLLDEPLAGLNHAEAETLAGTIQDLNRAGTTIILIEHNLAEVLRVCPRLVVMDNGRKIADGDARTVIEDPQVVAAYLGEGAAHAAA